MSSVLLGGDHEYERRRPGCSRFATVLAAILAVAPVVGFYATAVLLIPDRGDSGGQLTPAGEFQLLVCGAAALIATALMLHWLRHPDPARQKLNLGRSDLAVTLAELAIPTAITLGILLVIETTQRDGFDVANLFKPEWIRTLLIYIAWAWLQQLFILGYVFRRLQQNGLGARGAILLTALAFSLFHLPNPGLVALTLPSALVWTWVYSRYHNLLSVVLCHAIVGYFFQEVLGMNTRVGLNYLM